MDRKNAHLRLDSVTKRFGLTHLHPPTQAVDIAAQVLQKYTGEIVVAVDGTRVAI